MRKFLFLALLSAFLAWPTAARADVKIIPDLPEAQSFDEAEFVGIGGRMVSRTVIRNRVGFASINRVRVVNQVNIVREVSVVQEVAVFRQRVAFVPTVQVHAAYGYAAPAYAPAQAPSPQNINVSNNNGSTEEMRQLLQETRALNAQMAGVLRALKQ